MHPVYSDDSNECIPFRVGTGASESGPRIGGYPPSGIVPHRIIDARYFATFAITRSPVVEVSLFFPMDGDIVAAPSAVILDDHIEVVIHGESRRGERQVSPGLPEHPLILMPRKEDRFEDDEGLISVEPHHKFGGSPFLIHNEIILQDSTARLLTSGFRQVVQFDFPAGGDDALIDGPWPFADGMFHLFGRRLDSTWEWKWFWEL